MGNKVLFMRLFKEIIVVGVSDFCPQFRYRFYFLMYVRYAYFVTKSY